MPNEKISIIVPAYNAEATIERCILSVLHQTYTNIELILIDDGSTDETFSICKKYSNTCDNVIAINKDNTGVSAARNAGIAVASGVYVMFADADDFLDATMCEKLVLLLKVKESDAVICGYRRVEGGSYIKKIFINETINSKKCFMEKFPFIFENAFFNPLWNKIYKKSLITSWFDENFSIGEDLIFNINYFKNCNKVSLIEESLYNYTINRECSLASVYKKDLFEKEILLYYSVLDFCKNSLTNDTKCAIDRVFAKEVYYCVKKLIENPEMKKMDKLNILKSYLAHEDVKNISLRILNDRQIWLLFLLIKMNRLNTIYNFFILKKYLFERKKRYEN